MSEWKKIIRRILCVKPGVDLRSHLGYVFSQRILGINRAARWPVHFTSRVVAANKIQVGIESYPGDMPGCYIQGNNGIIIGDYCLFAPGVGLISANHDPMNHSAHIPAEPIRIGDNCWIGMNAVILPGVVLGPRTVVGAGSVVTSGFPEAGGVIAGNPARFVRMLSEME